MKARLFLLAGAVAFLAGCGSATDAVTFQAPPSFHSKASVGPFMQVWAAAPHNAIVLMSMPVAIDLNKAVSQADLSDARLQKKERIKICGGTQDALFVVLQGERKLNDDSTSTPSEIEFLATDVRGKTYMAMYARPLHSPADPAAQAAIRNVCPK
jgi:hypothetical protein